MLTSKAYWGDAGDKDYLCGDDRDEVIKQVLKVRDSPSELEYVKREEKLLEMTGDDGIHGALYVRPGQTNTPVSFHQYYLKNWKPCSSF